MEKAINSVFNNQLDGILSWIGNQMNPEIHTFSVLDNFAKVSSREKIEAINERLKQ